ncbi:MAG TPA: peptidylprolyl isomerase [Stellaceae bacterium]|nr:peptidylprolyl isomerase [Stellaceae bacterium]
MKWLIALFLVLACAAAPAQESHIVAVVNSEIITNDDLAARLKLVLASSNLPDTPENEKRLSAQVLRALIDEKLEMQEAKRLSISVPKSEVDDAIANIEKRNNMPKGGLDAYFKAHGIPRSTLVDQITATLAFGKIVHSRVSEDVSVSEDEVNDAMKRLKADIGKPQSRVSEIFLAVDNPSEADKVLDLANRLIAQIRGGANFSAVAQQFSQSPSAAVGGDIGWVLPDELSTRLAEALSKMKPGEMSYPIRTPAGFYILYLADRRTLGVTDPSQIELSLDEVILALPATATPDERQRILAEAQQVSDTVKSCGEMSKIGRERSPQLSREFPEIRAGELPPDLRQQILALKVGEASKPIVVPGGVGVVMVCSRKEPDTLPTRDEVSNNIARERYDVLARRYLRDLRRNAYVDIRG